VPVVPERLLPPDEDEPVDVFARMRAGDIFLHHPYESFTASTERFIAQAAEDPEVLTIKNDPLPDVGRFADRALADPGR